MIDYQNTLLVPVSQLRVGDVLVQLDGEHTITRIETLAPTRQANYRIHFMVRGREWYMTYREGRPVCILDRDLRE